MKVYYTCSTAQFQRYRQTYFHIREFLLAEHHLLTRDWLPHTEKRLVSGDVDIRDIKEIYAACVNAIKESDVVIIEDTVSNFSTGHQITLALQLKKPTLVLWQGEKYRQFKQMFIHGIESEILEVAEYSSKTLDIILRTFLRKYEQVHEKNRFHLVLSNMERQYLDWAQFSKGKSRTKVIRQALKSIIDNDFEYADFLNRKGVQ